MTYKAVLFDWGGVVTDDSGSSFYPELLKKYGASEEQVNKSLHLFRPFSKGEINELEFWEQVKETTGLNLPDDINDSFAHWPGIDANINILNLVKEIKDAGYITSVLSNVIKPTYEQINAKGNYDAFDYVIASWKTGYVKPDKEIYEFALRKLGVFGEDCIFIDDQERCLVPARNLGMQTVLAESAEQIIEEVRKLLKING